MYKKYNMRLLKLLTIALVLLTHNIVLAGGNEEHYYFKQIQLFDDMTSFINQIHINTKNGILWIATPEGLVRFDGKIRKRYSHANDNQYSLPGDNVINIIEDKNNIMWILTSDGIARYSTEYDNFTIPQIDNKAITAYSACLIENGILFGGNNRIYKYTYDTKTFEEVCTLERESNLMFSSIVNIGNDKILCASKWHGLLMIDLKTGKQIKSDFDNLSTHPMVFIKDSKERLWLSDFNQGLKCFDTNGKLLGHYTVRNSELSNNIILDIKEINNHIWIGTDGGGINILDPEKGTIKVMQHISGDVHSLPVNTITCLSGNGYDNIWAGSTKGGLIYIKKVKMVHYTETVLGYDKALSDKSVLSLSYNDKDNVLWIGTDGGGINSFNLSSETFRHYENTWGDQISSICDISDNKILVSVFSKGIYYLDKSSGKKTPLIIEDEELYNSLFNSGKSVQLRKYKENILLLSNNIYKYNIDTHKIDTIQYEGSTRNNESLYCFSEDDKTLYINDQHSIYKFKKDDNKLYRIYSVPFRIKFQSIARDKNGIFWIGDNKGLHSWIEGQKEMSHKKTSLFTKVNIVLCDTMGNIWIGAEKKLFAYQPQKEKFIMFDESDGVQPNEYSRIANARVPKNKMFIGGTNGLLYLNTDIINNQKKYDHEYKIYITDFIINGENKKYIIKNGEVSIPWNSKNLRLRVAVSDGDILRNKLYTYNINGIKKESFNPEMYVPILNPGTYHIKLTCDFKDGNYIKDYPLLTLTVLPPWYKTWWFLSLCIIFAMTVIVGTFMYFIRKKENKMKWIMKEHEQKIYEDKVRFLINVSHELRTPLTLIHSPLNRILKGLEKDSPIYGPLLKIYKQANRMKEIINMVLDMRRMETGYNALILKEQDFNLWLQEVCTDFKDECSIKNINLTVNIDNEIGKLSFDKNKCTIVITNLLSNALKHSPENTSITVTSTLNKDLNTVRTTVSDEGIGIKQEEIDRLFERFYQGKNEIGGSGIGLSYAKTIVEQHGGTIGAYPNKGKGASFFFEIPAIRGNEETLACKPKEYINEILGSDNTGNIVFENSSDEIEDKKILFIDDNRQLTDFMAKEMKHYYKEIITANSGKEVLGKIQSINPDIIISDVMMPDMDGFELCKAVKQDITISHIPVILLTAMEDEKSKGYGYKVGADAYISKPFQTEELKSVINSIIYNRKKAKEHYQSFGILPEPANETFSLADENFLKKLNKVIYDNIDNPSLDINMICGEMAMSRTSLYTKLKVLTEMGGNEYINKLKMEKAITLMSSGKYSVNEISVMVGFNTPRYFSTAFKQYTGLTPTQFKSQTNEDKE